MHTNRRGWFSIPKLTVPLAIGVAAALGVASGASAATRTVRHATTYQCHESQMGCMNGNKTYCSVVCRSAGGCSCYSWDRPILAD